MSYSTPPHAVNPSRKSRSIPAAPQPPVDLGLESETLVDESEVQEEEPHDELDLMYDPMLNCYYDPKTNKYYELK